MVEFEGKQFFMYLDLHGHSVKKNIFQYGNKIENLEKLPGQQSNKQKGQVTY
jgi:hypothetical protein